MMFIYPNSHNLKLLITFLALIIILTSCTGPYSVPKKDEGDKDTRVIFEESIEKEKNIQGLGVEINANNIQKCIEKGVNVIEHDIDEGLDAISNNSFDVVDLPLVPVIVIFKLFKFFR